MLWSWDQSKLVVGIGIGVETMIADWVVGIVERGELRKKGMGQCLEETRTTV